MANGSNTKKKRSVVKELGRAYASIPKEAGKAAKRMSKNFYRDVVKEAPDMIREIPSAVAKVPQVRNIAEMIQDPFSLKKDIERMGGKYKVPEGKMGGGRGKAKTARNMSAGGKTTTARGSGAARPQKFGKNG
tara:strand:+ start:125 stop:523 length:399 start_codon:yes stop_codon:yes gene_type:complete